MITSSNAPNVSTRTSWNRGSSTITKVTSLKSNGRTLRYALGFFRAADIHRELLEKCDDDPVVFTARVGSDTVYEITGATVLSDDVK